MLVEIRGYRRNRSVINPTPTRSGSEAVPPAASALDSAALPHRRSWLWRPNLIVFVSSACIMILELVAGRIIAPYVGVSLYTWTGIIGVVLAGISLGNYLGGSLADRHASLRLLGAIFVLAGVSSLGVLAVDLLGQRAPGRLPIVLQILALTSALFLLPSVILGTISPVVAKLAVQDLERTGRTVGRIYAAGSVGSIMGTFATGFLLISWLGTHVIVTGVALVLLSLGLVFLLPRRVSWAAGAILVLTVALVTAAHAGWLSGPCTRQTNYFCIRIHDEEREGQVLRVLRLDRLVHSYSSLDDPTHLVYGYEKVYSEVLTYRAERGDHIRALFIGGGGYTFPRYLDHVYPGSEITVIEIDPGVTEMAYEWLGLAPNTDIVTHNEDARLFMAREPAEPYDLVLGDAFNDFSVPYHLTTLEFNARVRAWLAEDGLYVINLIDGPRGEFLRAYVHTLRETFRHVYVAPTLATWRESTRSTFVLIASDVPLDRRALRGSLAQDAYPLLSSQLLSSAEVEELLGEERPILLTDRYAPVDQMLAPVIREETPP
jgi:spermidine synthase